MTDKTLLARIDRLESLDEIRQLPAKYSLSLDMRDMDAHVNLFAEDIRVSREKNRASAPEAMAGRYFASTVYWHIPSHR